MVDFPLAHSGALVDQWLTEQGRTSVIAGSEPMRREDVEGLICANGGTGEGLDLSFRNLNSADLSGLRLRGAVLRGADLGHADLHDCDLFGADLRESDLFRADLQGAFLMRANLEGAFLLAVRINAQTELGAVHWGKGYTSEWERMGLYDNAQSTYRQLHVWHRNCGYSDLAGEFLYREWVCRRKAAWAKASRGLNWWKLWLLLKPENWNGLLHFLFLVSFESLFGYGERPFRICFAAGGVILAFAVFYFFCPDPTGLWSENVLSRLWGCFYFSLVSFTTLGYGGWVDHPSPWARGIGGIESFIGLFITAMFLVTFTRKWSR